MDLMLTSFGLGLPPEEKPSPFHRLPPFVLDVTTDRFGFDYAGLLMFDRVIVDETTFRQALDPQQVERSYYGMPGENLQKGAQEYSEFLQSLEKSGRLLVRNFDEAVNESASLHRASVDYDMKNLTEWVKPLEDSVTKWRRTYEHICTGLSSSRAVEMSAGEAAVVANLACVAHIYGNAGSHLPFLIDVLKDWKKHQDPDARILARDLVRAYLAYVNQNIILSYKYGAPFIDWEDFQPFYEKKFAVAGIANRPGFAEVEQSRRLFDLFFPCCVPIDRKALVKAFEDKRLNALRDLVAGAIQGKVVFDTQFAAETLRQVLKVETKTAVRRKITGWATLPLELTHLIGLPKLVEEALNKAWSERPRGEYGWYYLMSELVIDKAPPRSPRSP